jgi:hypothetical protein
MGGWAEGQECADPGVRTRIGASGNLFYSYTADTEERLCEPVFTAGPVEISGLQLPNWWNILNPIDIHLFNAGFSYYCYF